MAQKFLSDGSSKGPLLSSRLVASPHWQCLRRPAGLRSSRPREIENCEGVLDLDC